MRRAERYATGLVRLADGHRGLVCLLWLAVLLAGGVAAATHLGRLDQSFTASGQDGSRVNAAIAERYGAGAAVAPLVAVVTWPDGTDGHAPRAAARLRSGLAAATAPGTRVVSYADTGDPAFLSHDGRTTFALVYPLAGKPDLAGLTAVREATDRLRTGLRSALPDARVTVTGVLPLQQDSATVRPGLGLQLLKCACALGALALLLRAFGPRRLLLPLLLTAVSSVLALLVVLALAGVMELSFVVVYLIPVASLALSVRRSALLVGAWRAELARGTDPRLAPRRAGYAVAGPATAGALAGTAAFAALALFPAPFLRAIGIAGAAVCLAGTLAALTLGPALLPRRERGPRHQLGSSTRELSLRRTRPARRLLAIGALVALGVLIGASGLLTAGNPRAEALVDSGPARDGLDQLTAAGIASGVLNPLELLAPSGTDAERAAARAAKVPGVLTAAAPRDAAWRRDGSALAVAIPSAEPMTPSGRRAMADVRSALAGTGVRVGGSGVPELDLVRGAYRALPGALAAMALLGFLALVRPRTAGTLTPAGRAVLSALVAAVAVTGLLVLVWQYGFGSRLLGGEGATGAVTGWVPLVAGAFAFLNALDHAVAYDALNAFGRAVAYDAMPRARYRVGPVVALPLLAIGLGPQVELALLVTGVGGAALLGSVLLRAVAVLSGPSRRVVHETATQPPASALPATPLSSYWSRPGLRLGHTIPLVEPPDHAQ
ncbi:MMPL family transporter [Streptomyces hundungensis]|uniref:MMPL family transporter n=1 Tax=Streptomyces hundungensis TaxID=1077946 RepID=UPI0033D5013D